MIRRTSSLIAVVVLTLFALASLASPAIAGKPITFSDHRVGFECPFLTNETGTLALAVFSSEAEEDTGFVEYWVAPDSPETGGGTFRSSSTEPAVVTVTGYHLEAVIPLENQDFEPVGDAIVVADLVTAGDPTLGPGKTRFGNRTIRDNFVEQPLVVESGTATLHDGTVFEFSECPGGELIIDYRETNPSQFVISFGGILVLCDIATEDYAVHIAASAGDQPSGGEVLLNQAGTTLVGAAQEGVTLTPTEFSATIPLVDLDTEEPAGDAIIEATLTEGQHVTIRRDIDTIRSTLIGNQLDVTGTVTFTEPGLVVDLSSCFAFEGREQHKEHRPDEPEE